MKHPQNISALSYIFWYMHERSAVVFSNREAVKVQSQFKIKWVLIGVVSQDKQGDPAGFWTLV